MENSLDSSAVPNLNAVVEEIFSSCIKDGKDVVPVSMLVEFMKPHLSNHSLGYAQLCFVLDPNNDNPLITRSAFYEAMQRWTAKMKESDSKLLGISFKDADIFSENSVHFHRSTPRPSLEPAAMKNSNDSLDFSNLSPTSFTANTRDISLGTDKLLFIEERYQELEHKHFNTMKEVSLLRNQLAASEEQYAELKQDLDRTNKRLMLEQQVIADLQKSMENNDDFKEEVCNTKKEKDHFHRMWLVTKRENVNLQGQIKDLEYEKELLDRKLSEIQKGEEQKTKEFCDLQTLFALYENENKLLKQTKLESEEKLQETKASLDHYMEVSEHAQKTVMILKNKIQALTAAYKKKGIDLNDQNVEKEPCPSDSPGILPNVPSQPQIKSSTPLKHAQQTWRRDYDMFTSPKLRRQLSSPITPGGLDTPKYARTPLLYVGSGSVHDSLSFSRECFETARGRSIFSPRTLQSNCSRSGRSKNLPSVGSAVEFFDIEKKRCFSETAGSSLQSESSVFETMEDLDMSSFSEQLLRTFNGQDLLSELQECKFLDNHNKCYVEEHEGLLKEHENCSQIIAEKEKKIESIAGEMEIARNEYNNILNKHRVLTNKVNSLEKHLKTANIENEELLEQNKNFTNEILNLKKDLESKNMIHADIDKLKTENEELVEQNNVFANEISNLKKNLEEIENLKYEKEQDLVKYNNIQNEKDVINANLDKLVKENEELGKQNGVFSNEIFKLKEDLKEIEALKHEREKDLEKYNTLKKDKDELHSNLEKLKKENRELVEQNNTFVTEIAQLKKDLKSKCKDLESITEKYEEIKNEKHILMKVNEELFNEKKNFLVEISNLKFSIEIKDKELKEMHNLRIKNGKLEEEVESMKLHLEKKSEEVTELSDKLVTCKSVGKCFAEKLNTKIKEQVSKFKFLEDFNLKLQEQVEELEASIEIERKRIDTLKTYTEVTMKYVPKYDDEDSASTASSENSQYQPRSKRSLSSGRKSNYERQQLKINKLEEKIEDLEKELSHEKSINEHSKSLENKINNLEMERINIQEEKESILRELEATKYDLGIKDEMLKQYEEKHKFDLENIKQSYEKEIELTRATQIEVQKQIEFRKQIELSHTQQIEELKKYLDDTLKEKDMFESMVGEQQNQIVMLKKALSDVSTSTEETGDFEMFNRELLLKSNNSLKQAENRCLSLELLLDKCKMVLSETVADIIRSSIEVYNSYKSMFEEKKVDPKLLHNFNILKHEESIVDDFTEKEVWLAQNNLALTSGLLKALVHISEGNSECSSKNDTLCTKSVNKFTLRPSKLQIKSSCDPITSSEKQNEVEPSLEIVLDNEVVVNEESKPSENKVSVDNLRKNESNTSWLDPCTDSLSAQITEVPNTLVDNHTETTELKKSFRSIGIGDSDIDEPLSIKSKGRKSSSFIVFLSVIMCLLAMLILSVHMECLRNGNNTIMCPLDLLVSIKREPTSSNTY